MWKNIRERKIDRERERVNVHIERKEWADNEKGEKQEYEEVDKLKKEVNQVDTRQEKEFVDENKKNEEVG